MVASDFSRAFVLSVILSATPMMGQALAQTNIGSAATVENSVSGILSGRTRAVSAGDQVFSNENIRTANASAAQLRFLDQSSLAIGPLAAVVLDRFVYNPDQTAREAALRVTTGAARWIGGTSQPQAYRIRTPQAIIGVRGTTFDLLVEARRTVVTLREGVIVVCVANAPRRCRTLSTPGQTVVVTSSDVQETVPGGPSQTQFAADCLRPVDRSACTIVAQVPEITPPAPTPVRRIATSPARRIVTAAAHPAITWTGFYAGMHFGGAGNNSSVDIGGSQAVLDSIALGNVPSALSSSRAAFIGGGHFGQLWQANGWVFGWEGDLSALSGTARETVERSPIGILVTTSAAQTIEAFSTLRLRTGAAIGDTLVYGTVGLATGRVKTEGLIAGACAVCTIYVGQQSTWQVGYAAGGGFERAFSAGQSIRFEYLYFDLGDQELLLRETTGLGPGEFATMRFHASGSIVRAAYSLRF